MPGTIALGDYRELVDLDRPFEPLAPPAGRDELPALVHEAVRLLEDEERAGAVAPGPDERSRLRALLTVRPAAPLGPHLERVLDALLGGERELRPLFDPASLPTIEAAFPGTAYPAAGDTVLWRGDITTLKADAVVNAANSSLLGCFVPMHPCIDNAIHSAAGPRLREDCDAIVGAQGAAEPTGTAKVTRAYRLPARYVLHTVGPIVDGAPSEPDASALAASYRSCLDVAARVEDIRTVAFCAVSTGVFGYPSAPACRVALGTVAEWLARHPGRFDRIVFDVYGPGDEDVYARTLAGWET